jgi:hypothetical protein
MSTVLPSATPWSDDACLLHDVNLGVVVRAREVGVDDHLATVADHLLVDECVVAMHFEACPAGVECEGEVDASRSCSFEIVDREDQLVDDGLVIVHCCGAVGQAPEQHELVAGVHSVGGSGVPKTGPSVLGAATAGSAVVSETVAIVAVAIAVQSVVRMRCPLVSG